MSTFSLPENCRIIEGLSPRIGAAGGSVIGAYISVKQYEKVYVVIHYQEGSSTSEVLGIMKSPLISGVGGIPTTELWRIWSNLDCATSDLLVERTAATSYAIGTGDTHKIIVFEVDPAALSEGYDCIAGYGLSGIAATDTYSMLYFGVPRYASRVLTAPTAITD